MLLHEIQASSNSERLPVLSSYDDRHWDTIVTVNKDLADVMAIARTEIIIIAYAS